MSAGQQPTPDHRSTSLASRLSGALIALLAIGAGSLLAAPAAAGDGGTVRIGRPARLPRGAVSVGPSPATTPLSGAVILRPRDARGLERLIAEVTQRGSPAFGQYLAKGQFAARFGPGAGATGAVRAQLARDRLRIDGVSADGLLVRFSGSTAQVASAFATGLERYRLPSGRLARAATSAPALPAALAGSVAAVVGLDEFPRSRHRIVRPKRSARHRAASPPARFAHPAGSPKPCAAARRDAAQAGGLTDDQIAYAYGAFGLYAAGDTGSAQHIGIYEQEPFLRSDVERFDACYFGARAVPGMLARLDEISVEGGPPQGIGEDGEAILDIEDVSAMAPGANVDVYNAPESESGELAELTAMVDDDRDQVITSSYGLPCEEEAEAGEPGIQEAENYLFQQAAAQGQTFLNASGDTGSDSCEEAHRELVPQPGQNPVSTAELASQPYVLGVGGTTITDAATQPAQEHVWNDGPEGGSDGGGISQSWAMPSWQRDSLVPGIALPGGADYTNAAAVEQRLGFPTGFCDANLPGASSTPCRLVPDVAAQADEFTGAPTFYSKEAKFEGYSNGWNTTGGTSSASPIWAAMLALVDASPTCRSQAATAGGVGFVNPLLYAIASDPLAYAASFNDIAEGNNDVYGLGGGSVFPARAGYDLASGLGSPRLTGPQGSAGLAYYMCSYAASLKPAVRSLAPSSGTTAGGELVTVSGRGFESAGTPDVAGVQIGAWHVRAKDIHVVSDSSLSVILPPARDTLPAGAPAPQDGAGPVQLIVTLADGQSSAAVPGSLFQYVDAPGEQLPSVTGLTPSGAGEAAPGSVIVFGSGFSGAESVSFGGVDATNFTVLSDSQIRAEPPPYSAGVDCTRLPHTNTYAGEGPANDICQVQVVVHGAQGASAAGKIRPPLEGALAYEQDGALQTPPGCGCEAFPAPTEFDYAPAPAVTSTSSSAGPAGLASETGGTLVTIHGTGLNHLTFDYAFFGPPDEESSIDFEVVSSSGTELQVAAPALVESAAEATVNPTSLPFSVRTEAGDSGQTAVLYAGVPQVSGVENTVSPIRLKGRSGAPDTGGTPILISGKGLLGQVNLVRFAGAGGVVSEGTQYQLSPVSNTRLSTQTVSQNPGEMDTQACTVTGCSPTSAADRLFLYPPGDPLVESLTPHSGRPAGGTRVLLHGQNLGCPLSVTFGGVPAQSVRSLETGIGCGSTTMVEASSPRGSAGAKVPVTLTTLESYFTGSGPAASEAQFTYTGP